MTATAPPPLSCKPAELAAGFYWYCRASVPPVVVEKREGERFVRFTNGGRQDWIDPGESFVGPLVPPAADAAPAPRPAPAAASAAPATQSDAVSASAKRLTLKSINAAVKARGIDATLYPGKDYFYFEGPAVEWAYSASVGVYRLNHLSMAQWMQSLDEIVQDSKTRAPA